MEFLERALGFASPELTGHDPNAEYSAMYYGYNYYAERDSYVKFDSLMFYGIILKTHRYGYEISFELREDFLRALEREGYNGMPIQEKKVRFEKKFQKL